MASVRSYQQFGTKSLKTSETQPFLHYSYILELSCFKMVYISSDRTFQAPQNGAIILSKIDYIYILLLATPLDAIVIFCSA
jgi:hypothetical protein